MNALKFTPSGGEIALSCREEDGFVEIVVRDTGLGIAQEKLASIFEPFVQVRRTSRSRPAAPWGRYTSPMRRTLCKSKIHRATLTGADLNYEGSLTLDRALMDAADMLPYERVQVVNVNNGARLDTYLIPGDAGSGVVQLNGAGARLGSPGDIVILMTYAEFEEDEVDETFLPRVVWVDETNRIIARD